MIKRKSRQLYSTGLKKKKQAYRGNLMDIWTFNRKEKKRIESTYKTCIAKVTHNNGTLYWRQLLVLVLCFLNIPKISQVCEHKIQNNCKSNSSWQILDNG